MGHGLNADQPTSTTVAPMSGTESGFAACPRVVYFLASFPALRNTFVVRELDGLVEAGLAVEAVGLLRPETGVRHARAERWVKIVPPRPSRSACVAATGWWLLHRPLRMLAVAGAVVRVNLLPRHRVRAGIASVLLGAFHARRLRNQPSVHIHSHFEIPTDTAWVVHRLSGTSFSFTVHTDEAIMVPSLARNARAATFVATPSHYTQRRLQERVGATVSIAVVRAAVPTNEYAFRPRTTPSSGPVRAVCVAGLEPCKGHSVLLEALAGDPSLFRVRLDVVGDGPVRGDLERRVDELGLRERVRFQGAKTEDEVRLILYGADLFVLPCTVDGRGYHDNLPVALMEAMASGVPVISTRLGGIPELVVDGITGALAQPGDVDDLRRTLTRVIDSGSVIETVTRARATVEEEFDMNLNAQRLARLLCEASAHGVHAEVPRAGKVS